MFNCIDSWQTACHNCHKSCAMKLCKVHFMYSEKRLKHPVYWNYYYWYRWDTGCVQKMVVYVPSRLTLDGWQLSTVAGVNSYISSVILTCVSWIQWQWSDSAIKWQLRHHCQTSYIWQKKIEWLPLAAKRLNLQPKVDCVHCKPGF